MPVTQWSSLKPGLPVSIVLKADQRTGRQVQGTVAQLLTRHNHPRGIKVKLTDGRIGRVEKIISQTAARGPNKMASNDNPWATESTGNPSNPHSSEQPRDGASQSYYQSNPSQQQSQGYQQSHPQQQSYNTQAPSQGIHRSDTEQLLAQQGDRAEQVEHMQQFEANANETQDDRNQAQLQKEFPNIDSSLIAAIYNERKGGDLGEVREMLQELNSN